MTMKRKLGALAALLPIWLGAGLLAGCLGDDSPQADRNTRRAARAVEERVGGTFLDYYTEVLSLATRYGAQPDSFRAALDAHPGSHLTDEEWAAWTAPYAEDADHLMERLSEVTATASHP